MDLTLAGLELPVTRYLDETGNNKLGSGVHGVTPDSVSLNGTNG